MRPAGSVQPREGDAVLTASQQERFWLKVEKTSGCWFWQGWLKHNGYGMFDVAKGIKRQAHRIAYELCVGPIADGMTIDHIKDVCTSRACVRPDHLRQMTRGENVLAGDTLAAANKAKTHCIHGHEFTLENTYVPPKRPTRRYCKRCMRDRASTRKAVMTYR